MPQPRLPDFLIIGGMRCGTSATRASLNLHPNIFFPAVPHRRPRYPGHTSGEAHFFDDPARWSKGFAWYKKLFASAGARLAGDKTPRYISVSEAMARIARHMPGVPMVVMLRNPVVRLWSEFRFHNTLWWRKGKTSTFAEFTRGGTSCTVIVKGNYGDHLAQLLKLFPREQIHVEYTEISAADPRAAIRRIQTFLGVEPVDCSPAGKVRLDPGKRGKDYRPMPAEQAERFREHYRKQNEKLYELLGDEHIKTWF